ncbi:MAG: hypothetical protein WB526_05915 [Candidatus Cybelea sp.]
MKRSLVVAGALALALLPPAVTLGAPTAVVRSGPIAPPPTRSAQTRYAGQDSFKVPFHVDLRPKWGEPTMQSTLSPYRSHEWQWAPQYVGNQPLWYQNGCFANSLFGTPSTLSSDGSVGPGVTLGSLVDDRSRHLISSSPSGEPNLPLSGNAVVTLQPTSCGSANIINL